MSHILITGVPSSSPVAPGGSPPSRTELNIFVKNDKQFSLFIQALQVMENTAQSQPTSHFQLAGIHGLPYTPWQGSGSSQPVSGTDWGGYCTHGSVLFPTWHRPYLALYEQLVQSHAASIAATYVNDTADWENAAAALRLPYWDWAQNANPPTQLVSDATVEITTPNGQRTPVTNPLLAYHFNPIEKTFPSVYQNWRATVRHPTSSGSDAVSNVDELLSDLQAESDDIRTKTYNLLTRVTTWPAFSNHTAGDGGSSSSSIEAIHDGLHDDIGAGGHMSDPSVAAFDPIFWLHHCNVDHILALWQSINPGVWVTQGPAEEGTFTTKATATDDQTSALTPFWNGQSTYWNSVQARDFQHGLNYTYPEFVGLNMGDSNAVRSAILSKVNEMYGDSSRKNFAFAASDATDGNADDIAKNTPSNQGAPDAAQQLFAAQEASSAASAITGLAGAAQAAVSNAVPSAVPRVISAIAQLPHQTGAQPQQPAAAPAPPPAATAPPPPAAASAPPPPPSTPAHVNNPAQVPLAAAQPTASSSAQTAAHPAGQSGHAAPAPKQYLDWVARVHCKKYELGASYCVLIFLGHVPENSHQWRSSPNFVGAHHVFVNSQKEKCENCHNQTETITEGFVSLNRAIAKHGHVKCYDSNVVEPYLKKDLSWRVQASDRTEIPIHELKSLQVTVISQALGFHHGDSVPRMIGTVNKHHTCTDGKTGGHPATPAPASGGEQHHSTSSAPHDEHHSQPKPHEGQDSQSSSHGDHGRVPSPHEHQSGHPAPRGGQY